MILRFMEGLRVGKSVKINKDDYTIGRDDSCELLLNDEGISRIHCRIVQKGEIHFIRDNNSTNGVYVNGDKVEGSRELKINDTIRIGDCLLLFTSDVQTDPHALTALNDIVDSPSKPAETQKGKLPENVTESVSTHDKKNTDDSSNEPTIDEVRLNFDKDKDDSVSKNTESKEKKALLNGSNLVVLIIVVVLIVVLLYLVFAPN